MRRESAPAAPAPLKADKPAVAVAPVAAKVEKPAVAMAPVAAKVEKPAAPVAAREASPSLPRAAGEANRVVQIAEPSRPVSGPIGRSRTELQLEDIFSDLFERTQDVYGMSAQEALNFLLDLAMEKIPSDAGSVFLSGLAAVDLQLLAARGPKAGELEKMKLRVPMGVGIVGFCAQEAVSVAISDTERDPRFYRSVSEKIGYAAKSILCAPMVSGGRTFGCLEIINRKGTSHFTDAELAILGYVAHQGAKFLEQAA
jgi:putative methionine-R-sulfoxide reductase with GAF domain